MSLSKIKMDIEKEMQDAHSEKRPYTKVVTEKGDRFSNTTKRIDFKIPEQGFTAHKPDFTPEKNPFLE